MLLLMVVFGVVMMLVRVGLRFSCWLVERVSLVSLKARMSMLLVLPSLVLVVVALALPTAATR